MHFAQSPKLSLSFSQNLPTSSITHYHFFQTKSSSMHLLRIPLYNLILHPLCQPKHILSLSNSTELHSLLFDSKPLSSDMDQETPRLLSRQHPLQDMEPEPKLASNQETKAEKSVPIPKFSRRVLLKDVVGQGDGLVGERLIIGGWVKSSREIRKDAVQQSHFVAPAPVVHKEISCTEVLQSRVPLFRFIIRVLGGGHNKLDAILPKPPQLYTSILQINDGSCISNFQVLVESTLARPSEVMPTGVCILVEGTLQQLGQGKQGIELKADKILHLGTVDESKYPLSKKRVPLDLLRDSPHYRPRTKTVASVMRVRNALTRASHSFFDNHGFIEVQVPIITTTDAEGFSKKFQVTTLLEKIKMEDKIQIDERVSLETLKASIQEKKEKIEELKRSNSNKEAVIAAVRDLKNTTELASQVEKGKGKPGTLMEAHKLNFAEEYFSRPTFLTVSGHLHLASYACALGNVYSFGPRFRADKAECKKSVAEMWTVELEMAFSELKDAMECAEALLKSMCEWVSTKCSEDLTFISKRIDKNSVERLQLVTKSSFKQISYTEAVNILQQVTEKKFQVQVEWGNALTEEHESYLVEMMFKVPIIIFNHPKDSRPFHARLNDDGKTVTSFDVVVPKVGTLIRGSQNEERLNVLTTRMKALSLSEQEYEWCLDLRRHGTVKHSGFSLVFELLVLYATGLVDLRDSVPFPRNVGKVFN